jgi:predicted Zn-dependent peptidase
MILLRPVETELLPGVRLRCVQTDKFRTGTFSVSFLRPLLREEAAKNALLMNVLARGTRAYPDMERLQAACSDAWGVEATPFIRQYGEALAIGFTASFPEERWFPEAAGELERVIRLVSDLCLDPCTKGGLLRSDYVLSERQKLRDRIRAEINDKQSYARHRARQLMCPEEAYGVFPLGGAEEAEKLTHVQMTRHHQLVLASSPVRIFYCGAADPQRVLPAVQTAFQTVSGAGERSVPVTELRPAGAELRRETEYMDVTQGKLVLGCRMGESFAPAEQPALQVFNALFGASHASRLFREVRERRSLCYSIVSGTDVHKSVLTVNAGVGWDRAEEVLEAVLAELEACSRGEIPQADLEAARRTVSASFLAAEDSGPALDAFFLAQELLDSAAVPEQLAALALEVTAEEAAEMAARVEPDLAYLLRGGTGEGPDGEEAGA